MRDLRRALEDLRHEKEVADAKASRASDLEDVVAELRHNNRSLEERIARLCETPFINDAFSKQENLMRLEDAAREREEYKTKVSHLQEAVRTHFSALTSLKQQAAQLREEKEAADQRCEEMRLKHQQLEAGQSALQDKLRLYSGDDGVDIESLEHALTLVKRRTEALEGVPFLEKAEANMITLPALKKRVEEKGLLNLQLAQEVERLETMLKLQSGINRSV